MFAPSCTEFPVTTDYKSSVFLPKTDFPMRAGLPRKEPELLKRWADMHLFERLRAEDLTARGRGPADKPGPVTGAARVTAPPASRPPAAAAPTQGALPLFPPPEPASRPSPRT